MQGRGAVLQALLTASTLSQLCRARQSRPSTVREPIRSMSHSYKYPRPSVSVDAVILALAQQQDPTRLLLIQRKHPPWQGQWALPGGFVNENEPLDKAAARELQEETSVDPSSVELTQVGAFGDPGRDPRGWCVSVAYAALVPSTELGVTAADDAEAADWFAVTKLPKLAFDHKLIVRTAFQHVLDRHAAGGHSLDKQVQEELQRGAQALEGPWEVPKE